MGRFGFYGVRVILVSAALALSAGVLGFLGCDKREIEVEVDPEFTLTVVQDSARTFPDCSLGLALEIVPRSNVEDMAFFVRMEHAGSGNTARLYLAKDPLQEVVAGGDSLRVGRGSVPMVFTAREERVHELVVIVSNNYGGTKRERIRVAVTRQQEPNFSLQVVPAKTRLAIGEPVNIEVRLAQDFPSDRVWYSLRCALSGSVQEGSVFTVDGSVRRRLGALDTVAFSPGRMELLFESMRAGERELTLTVRDSEGRQHVERIGLEVIVPKFGLDVQAAQDRVNVGVPARFTLGLRPDFPNKNIRYGLQARLVGENRSGTLFVEGEPRRQLKPTDSVGITPGNVGITFETARAGLYDLEFTVRDSENHERTERVTLEVVVPTFTLTVQAPQTRVNAGVSVPFSVDLKPEFASSHVGYSLKARLLGDGQAGRLFVESPAHRQLRQGDSVAVTPGSLAMSFESLRAGLHEVEITARDSEGNWQSVRVAFEVVVPSFSVSLEAAQRQVRVGVPARFSLTLSPEFASDLVWYSLRVSLVSGKQHGRVFWEGPPRRMLLAQDSIVLQAGTQEFTLESPRAGEYELEFTVRDSEGRVRAQRAMVEVVVPRFTMGLSAVDGAVGPGLPVPITVSLSPDFASDQVWYSLRARLVHEGMSGTLFAKGPPRKQLRPSDSVLIVPGESVLEFSSMERGVHDIEITVRNSEGQALHRTVSVEVKDPGFELDVSVRGGVGPNVGHVVRGEPLELLVGVRQTPPNPNVRYRLSYRNVVPSGVSPDQVVTGQLYYDKELTRPVLEGEQVDVPPQNGASGEGMSLFLGREAGNHYIEVEVSDGYGNRRKHVRRLFIQSADEPTFGVTIPYEPINSTGTNRVKIQAGEEAISRKNKFTMHVSQGRADQGRSYKWYYKYVKGDRTGLSLSMLSGWTQGGTVSVSPLSPDQLYDLGASSAGVSWAQSRDIYFYSEAPGDYTVRFYVQSNTGGERYADLHVTVEPQLGVQYRLTLDEGYPREANVGMPVSVDLDLVQQTAQGEDIPVSLQKPDRYMLKFRHLGDNSSAQIYLAHDQNELTAGYQAQVKPGRIHLFFKSFVLGKHIVEVETVNKHGLTRSAQFAITVHDRPRPFTARVDDISLKQPYICATLDAPAKFRSCLFTLSLTDLEAPVSAQYKLYFVRDGAPITLHNGDSPIGDGIFKQGQVFKLPASGYLPLRVESPIGNSGHASLRLFVENETGYRAEVERVLSWQILPTPPIEVTFQDLSTYLKDDPSGHYSTHMSPLASMPKDPATGNRIKFKLGTKFALVNLSSVFKYSDYGAYANVVKVRMRVHRAYLGYRVDKGGAVPSEEVAVARLRYPAGGGDTETSPSQFSGEAVDKDRYFISSCEGCNYAYSDDPAYYGVSGIDNYSMLLKPHFLALSRTGNDVYGEVKMGENPLMSEIGKIRDLYYDYSPSPYAVYGGGFEFYLYQIFALDGSYIINPETTNYPGDSDYRGSDKWRYLNPQFQDLSLSIDLFVEDIYGYTARKRIYLPGHLFSKYPLEYRTEFFR